MTNKQFYLTMLPSKPDGYVCISTSSDWEPWLRSALPDGLADAVKSRLVSNLKHVLVALEMKAALIQPHADREKNKHPSLVFEPYYNIMVFEFCVGTFSLCEGFGSAIWLRRNGLDGSAGNRIGVNQWQPALVSEFDADGKLALAARAKTVKAVRDKLHQDQLGLREQIDWHAFSYDGAFKPALEALRALFAKKAERVPATTNLK